MKKILFLLSAAVAGVSVFADDWTYNPEAKCVSDNIWTFSATDNGSGGITFNRVQQVPGAVSPLDFSKPVKDVDGNSMTIVSIDRIFGYFNQTMPLCH